MKTIEFLYPAMPLAFNFFCDKATEITSGVYTGGSWNDAELAPGITYLKLNGEDREILVHNFGLQESAKVNNEVFGIVVTLHFLSHVTFRLREGQILEEAITRFHKLRAWVMENHKDAGVIAMLLD